MNVETLAWKHNRSALVHLMLSEGYKYIICEVSEMDKDFDVMDSLAIYIITTVVESQDGSLSFGDIEGNIHAAAQAINNDGTVMTYDDYLMLKQLEDSKNDK